MPEVSLKELSDAAQGGAWHTVDTPWGDGDWIVAGNPDPHAGRFVCLFDGSLIGVEADDSFHADPAENAAFVVEIVNAFRAKRLHTDDALASAVAHARREALEEAVGLVGRFQGPIPIKLAHDIRALADVEIQP